MFLGCIANQIIPLPGPGLELQNNNVTRLSSKVLERRYGLHTMEDAT